MITFGNLQRWPLSVRVMIGVAVASLVGIYLFYPAYPTVTGKSLWGWTWAACNSANGFLHGRLALLIFPYLVWWAWKCRQEEVVKPSCLGLIWLCLGLLLFWASMRVIQPRWALAGMPFLTIGLVHYLFGGRIARAFVFPAFFLWFTIPIPGVLGWINQHAFSWLVPLTHQAGLRLGMDVVKEEGVLSIGDRDLWIGGF